MNIVVVGLGRLGAPLAAVLADSGHDVTGVDLDQAAVDSLAAGRAPVEETGLQEVLNRAKRRLRATTDASAAVRDADATFIIVPTPSRDDGSFALDFVEGAIASIGAGLRGSDRWHLVVVTSTVLPGSTSGPIRRALEEASDRRVGDSLGLCYGPEFIALGSVISDMTHPDFLLVGESDERAGDAFEKIALGICKNNPPVMRMNLVNAEIAKIAVNTFVTTKISYANMLAEICEQLDGADVDVVTDAIGLDSRIGRKYLRGATAYGGPCFPRDNAALASLARSVGVGPDIAEATDRINARQAGRLADLVMRHVSGRGGRVAIFGMSYKPRTAVIEVSTGVDLARELVRRGIRPMVWDPEALATASALLGSSVDVASEPSDARGSDVIVVTTPWGEFSGYGPAVYRGAVVVDCWRLIDPDRSAAAAVVYLGASPDEPVIAEARK
jgi:UDPglucose 6-dehydrogenase